MSFYNRSTLLPVHSPAISVRKRRSTIGHPLQMQPKKKQPTTIEEIREQIIKNHESINQIIFRFKEVIAQRLKDQQLQLLTIFKHTMDTMIIQIDQIVKHYQKAIEEVRVDLTISRLQNQLTYFKQEALTLFDINNANKKQILSLKKLIFDLKIDQQISNKTIQKLTKRIVKNKIRNHSLLTDNSRCQPILPFVTQDSQAKVPYIKTQRKKTLGDYTKKLI